MVMVMVKVDLCSIAHCHKVSNALSTLVTREQPSFQAPFEGHSPAMHEGHQAEFQTVGPCTANARRPTVESRCRCVKASRLRGQKWPLLRPRPRDTLASAL